MRPQRIIFLAMIAAASVGASLGATGCASNKKEVDAAKKSLYDTDFSGKPYGNYASQWRRLTSGFHKVITEGFITLTP